MKGVYNPFKFSASEIKDDNLSIKSYQATQ
jgi:hypothetical protein